MLMMHGRHSRALSNEELKALGPASHAVDKHDKQDDQAPHQLSTEGAVKEMRGRGREKSAKLIACHTLRP